MIDDVSTEAQMIFLMRGAHIICDPELFPCFFILPFKEEILIVLVASLSILSTIWFHMLFGDKYPLCIEINVHIEKDIQILEIYNHESFLVKSIIT